MNSNSKLNLLTTSFVNTSPSITYFLVSVVEVLLDDLEYLISNTFLLSLLAINLKPLPFGVIFNTYVSFSTTIGNEALIKFCLNASVVITISTLDGL
jgi:hypothetical protein